MKLSSNTEKWTGWGESFGLALGGIIAPNLALFGTLNVTGLSDPNEALRGAAQGTQHGVDVSLAGFGAGLAYYLEPLNLYLSGALEGMAFSMQDTTAPAGTPTRNSKGGLGFQAMVGKEWWVTDNWGLGVAAELLLSSMKDDPAESSDTFSATTFALLFSATYN
jgi:hypothetical protein